MAKPLVVDVPHELGKDEAKRRLVDGTEKVRDMLAKSGVQIGNLAWSGDRLDFAVSAMGQKVDGQIDVNPETVRIEVRLPLLLALFAEKIQRKLGRQTDLLLTKR